MPMALGSAQSKGRPRLSLRCNHDVLRIMFAQSTAIVLKFLPVFRRSTVGWRVSTATLPRRHHLSKSSGNFACPMADSITGVMFAVKWPWYAQCSVSMLSDSLAST